MRDEFSLPTKELLAKRVAHLCSNPGCRQPTSGPQQDTLKAVNIGVAAHICAASPGGPRFDAETSPQERSAIGNAIWLCQTCAKLIDSDPARYSAAKLLEWKRVAETEAAQALERRRGSNDGHEDAFLRAERLMPDLLSEMKKDISAHPLCREFIVLKKGVAFWYPEDREMFTYFFDDHDSLDGKLRILQNLRLIRDIKFNNVPRFVIEEEFVDYLTR